MREIIENFINQYNRPFTIEVVAEMTALEMGKVKPVIQKLIKDKTLKYIDAQEGIMVRNNRFNPVVCYRQKGSWRFDPAAASALLDVIEKGQYTSIRSIALACGRSRQWAFVYMEALASMGLLGMRDYVYVVLSRENICDIGMVIKPGILGEIRPQLSPEEREQRAIKAQIKRTNKRQSHLQELTLNFEAMGSKERKQALKMIQSYHAHQVSEARDRWERNQAKRQKRKNKQSNNSNNNS
ncbi:MAG: hypothetical protein WC944_04910 [Candidatus Cloacimonadaceae bacterium]|jgi:hypothetical protein|nr:hypothetical protein [Candidatus Cloacimonadota bacterium]MCK9242921.1 hypothetical protein [Candidatus Cloacimonadota bacterium]